MYMYILINVIKEYKNTNKKSIETKFVSGIFIMAATSGTHMFNI